MPSGVWRTVSLTPRSASSSVRSTVNFAARALSSAGCVMSIAMTSARTTSSPRGSRSSSARCSLSSWSVRSARAPARSLRLPPTARVTSGSAGTPGTGTLGTCTWGNCARVRGLALVKLTASRKTRLASRTEENHLAGRIIQHETMTTGLEEISERIAGLLPRLRRFARALSRNQYDADDLVQSAVERAWRHHEQLKPGANLASWMFGIMKNAWIDNLRTRRRRGEVALPEDSGEHPAVSPVDTSTEMWSVSEAMSKLPEDQRLAIALVLVEGMSYKEAAELLDIPIGTLTSRLARARTALAAQLGDTP